MGLSRRILSMEVDLRPLWLALRDHPVEDLCWLGVLLRVVAYLWNRPYWMDEGSLLSNFIGVRILDFSTCLSGDQLAPFGFVIVERVIVTLLGTSGYATRLVPLICGIASLWLFKRLAFRLLAPGPAMVALVLFALSDDMVYYSSELKPYSCDLLIGLAITLLSLQWLDGALRGRALAALVVLMVAAPWFSFSSSFVIAGCGTALLINRLSKRAWAEVGWLLAIAAGWTLNFTLAYRASHALLHPATSMYVFWNFAFLPLPPSGWADVVKVAGVLLEIFVNPLNLLAPVLPAWWVALPIVLLLIGAGSMAARDGAAWLVLTLPILLAVAAAGLRKYPLHGRLMIELVPPFYLMIAEGTRVVRARLGRPAYVLVLVLLLAYPSLTTFYQNSAKRKRYFNEHGDLHDNRFLPAPEFHK